MSSKIIRTKKSMLSERSISESFLLLFPILFIVIFLPLIVKMKTYDPRLASFDWFADQTKAYDFFLYYKQWFFVGICGIIALIIIFRALIDKTTLKFNKTYIPILIYAFFALISTLFSEYRVYGFSGSFEQFENVFCLIGYALVVYYIYLVIQTEKELKLFINAVAIGALCVGTIGTFQAFGMDIFNTQFGRQIIAESGHDPNSLGFVFGEGHVYATLYNPNYVGVYTAIMIPLFTIMLFFSKRKKEYALYSLVVISSLISMFGSQSKAGIISIAVAFIFALFFLRGIIIKRKIITLSIISVFIVGFFVINYINNNAYINSITNIFKYNSNTNTKLTSIDTIDSKIIIKYAGYSMYAELTDTDTLLLYDENKSPVAFYTVASEEAGNILQINDIRFSEIVIILPNNAQDITFFIEGRYYTFSNKIVSGKFLFYNRYGKYSPLISIDSGIFKNREGFATNRGFIWGRTIPLLDDYLLLGSGADSFINVFPQYDYVNYNNYGYEAQLISKPHSYYLQVSVQTGFTSLLSLLIFFAIYIIQSFKLYYNNTFSTFYSKVGLSICIGIISYLISCLTNDSSISVAPVFWSLIGIGFVVNTFLKDSSYNE